MMMGMTNPKVTKPTRAVWWLKSKDKQWCDAGFFIYYGMRGIPHQVSIRIEELKLISDPPEDLEWGFRLTFWGYYGRMFLCLMKKPFREFL